MIDKEKMLARSGQFPAYETVPIPEFGDVMVKVMTVGEKDAFDIHITEKKYGFRTGLILACTISENGALFFGDDDISKIENMPFYFVEPIVEAALRVNKIGKQDQEALAKNSSGQSDDSSSA